MSEHTKEPWIIGCMDDTMIIADHVAIAVHRHKDGTRRKDAMANAARIVACVNACADLGDVTGIDLIPYTDYAKLEAELAALKARQLTDRECKSLLMGLRIPPVAMSVQQVHKWFAGLTHHTSEKGEG